MNHPNHRQCFHQIMASQTAPWIPNYELGCWGQTVQRWLAEGAPSDRIYWNFWQGEPFFQIDRHDYAHLNAGMIPEFEYQVLEEDADYLNNEDGESANDLGEDCGLRSAFTPWTAVRQSREAPNRLPWSSLK